MLIILLNSSTFPICYYAQDYTDDENGDEDETPVNTLAKSKTTTTTTSTTTSTTTTTTTPKPSIKQRYDYRDQRAYEGGTGTQYNGYQAKNDYPPMSAHSVHKWQSLGTREGVKQTRNNMQQYNKNGKSERSRRARIKFFSFVIVSSLINKRRGDA